jgi:hypothetical protein
MVLSDDGLPVKIVIGWSTIPSYWVSGLFSSDFVHAHKVHFEPFGRSLEHRIVLDITYGMLVRPGARRFARR